MTTSLLTTFLIGMPGGSEWIFIILAIILLFGGRKIPELMKGIGKGIREFNDAKSNVKNEIEEGMKERDKDDEIKALRDQLQQKQASELQQKQASELPK